jgi:hypothetical protein
MRRWSHHPEDSIFVAIAMLLLLLGTDLFTNNTVAQEPALANTLRFGAHARDFLMGAAVASQPLESDKSYAQTLAREFNIVVPRMR